LGLATAEPKLRRLIDAYARFYELQPWVYRGQPVAPGELLEGLILTESSGNPRARRYEPHQDRKSRRDAPQDPDTWDRDDGEIEDDASYGLMQVMGYNARRYVQVFPVQPIYSHASDRPAGLPPAMRLQRNDTAGVNPPMGFTWLFNAPTNIDVGLWVLRGELVAVRHEVAAGKIDPGQDLERALARYNGGPTGDDLVGGDYRLRAYVDKVGRNAALARQDRARIGWK
jgi:hypothetical protein